MIREIPHSLDHEPIYPGLDTVVFSIRFPDWTIHKPSWRCDIECPHLAKREVF